MITAKFSASGHAARTLAIIKPDVCPNPTISQQIIDSIKADGFVIENRKSLNMTVDQAACFYKVHRGRFFYPRLVRFMSSGPIETLVLSRCDGKDPVTEWRLRLQQHRALFGFSDTLNVVHGSDSPENALEEISFFFPDLF